LTAPPSPAALRQGRLALLAAGVLWSLGGVFIKRLPVGPVALTFYRSLFAALTLLALVSLRGALRHRAKADGPDQSTWQTGADPGLSKAFGSPDDSPRVRPVRDLTVSALLFAGLLVTFVAATRLTTAANAIILQYTAPIYVIGLSAMVLRETPGKADLLALALCMAGVAEIFWGSHPTALGTASHRAGLGLALGATSGLCFGLFTLWQRRLRAVDPMLLAGLNNAGASLVLALGVPWMGRVDAPSLGLLVAMGVVQIAVPYVLFAWALQRVSGPEASLLTLIEPVLNPVWVALFVGETPSGATIVGGGLILVALLLRFTAARPA
jgi:DME family drug/metabolite transporter